MNEKKKVIKYIAFINDNQRLSAFLFLKIEVAQ